SPTKSTDYVGEFIYENDEIALVQHEEGRIVPNAITGEWAYEYYLKDHLGNTRVTFTTNPKEIEFTANYESNPAVPDDLSLFENVDNTTITSNDLFDHTDEAGNTYTHTQLLTGGLNSQVGSVIAIPVGMGDTLNAEVFAKYKDNNGNGNNSGAAIAGLLINAFTGGTGMTNELGNQSINNNFGSGSLIGTTGFAPEDANAPMAFLNIMFLPEGETNDLEKDVSFAYDQIDGAAEQPNSPTKAAHDRMHIDDFVAPDQGYVLIYLSNESAVMTEVYFDDLKVTVNEHPVIQSDDFYPFGGQFNSYQRITAKQNDFLFNGIERETELGLGWDVAEYRSYDPMIGRWLQIDPKTSERESPYVGFGNRPNFFIDPLGDTVRLLTQNDPRANDGATYITDNVTVTATEIPSGGNPLNGFRELGEGLKEIVTFDVEKAPREEGSYENGEDRIVQEDNDATPGGDNAPNQDGSAKVNVEPNTLFKVDEGKNAMDGGGIIIKWFVNIQDNSSGNQNDSNGAFRGNYPKLVRGDTVFGYQSSYRLKSQNGDTLYNYQDIPVAPKRKKK
ncbi:MAG: RHS repeat-associated core domain-containing protein, partial [Bacteroidota bacterium]